MCNREVELEGQAELLCRRCGAFDREGEEADAPRQALALTAGWIWAVSLEADGEPCVRNRCGWLMHHECANRLMIDIMVGDGKLACVLYCPSRLLPPQMAQYYILSNSVCC